MINPFASIHFYQKSGPQFILWRDPNIHIIYREPRRRPTTRNLIPVIQLISFSRFQNPIKISRRFRLRPRSPEKF